MAELEGELLSDMDGLAMQDMSHLEDLDLLDGPSLEDELSGTAAAEGSLAGTEEESADAPAVDSAQSTPPADEDSVPRQTYRERVQVYEAALNIDPIDRKVIEKLSFAGIPDAPGLRGRYWKILLHYLPRKHEYWEEELAKNRKTYRDWIQELILDPHEKYTSRNEGAEDVSSFDHPLSMSDDSVWKQYFADREMMEEIDKDVRRTFPHLHFFNKDGEVGSTRHHESLRRILFIYAKLNPGICYVQGMNELLGPIYYSIALDPTLDADAAEADGFHCFKNLMAEVRDNFCKTLDHSELGITANMRILNQLVKRMDKALWQHLEEQSLNPQFYSFRWITLLLSQEFDLPEVLRLWDCLLADPSRFEFFRFCCVAMLQCVRDRLMANDFATNLKLLQSYPPEIELTTILRVANDLRERYREEEAAKKEAAKPPPPQPAPAEAERTGFFSFFTSSPARK